MRKTRNFSPLTRQEILKVRKTKIKLGLALIVIIQILLLMNINTAESYLIHKTDKIIEDKIIEPKDNKDYFAKDLINNGANLLVGLLSIKQIGIVSASDTSSYPAGTSSGITAQCCLKNNNGAICNEYSSTIINGICATDKIFPGKCSDSSVCQTGCCIDEKEGSCSTKSTRGACETNGGTWKTDENCNIAECKKGCCILGQNVQFVTEKRCDYLSLLNGFEKDYSQVGNELECLAMAPQAGRGACVVEESCVFGTAQECLARKGNFYENKLCSNPSLNTKCKKQSSINCVEQKDEIYWFDSCGNMENIYSSDKDASWNNGGVLSKEESCNVNSGNIESETCGNCNYLLGSKCAKSTLKKVKDGNFICEDLTCDASEETGGVKRENGESWCVYDSFIGEGKDTVGSRHWKRVCVDGKVQVEPCADYRGELCVQSDIDVGDGEEISAAACVINRGLECVNYNQNKDTMEKNCKENSQCQLTEVDVDEGFKFKVCTAKYPGGFDLTGESERGTESASTLCSLANQKCTVIYVKKLSGKWECMANCDCEKKKFTEEMNNLCIGLGDCGSYINYVGDGSDNIKVKGAPKVSWTNYKKYAQVVEGQKAEPDTIEDLKRISLGGKTNADGSFNFNSVSGIMGALGISSGIAAHMIENSFKGLPLGLTFPGSVAQMVFGGQTKVVGLTKIGAPVPIEAPTLMSSFANALSGAGVGATVGGLVAKGFGLQGDAAMATTVAGAVAGTISGAIGVNFFGGGLGAGGSFAAIGAALSVAVIALIAALVVAIVMKLLGIGKIKKVIVKFSCLPWQPPVGGANCEKCNAEPLKPCTQYRCTSLGKACELINTESSNPECTSIKNDNTYPKISSLNTTSEYKFEEQKQNSVKIKTTEDGCAPALSSLTFSLQTDERAQCKYDFNPGVKYDEMSDSPLEGTYYTKTHAIKFDIPGLDELEANYGATITGDIKEKTAQLKMNVKCQDVNGNTNPTDYVIDLCVKSGPDQTAPMIIATLPVNNAYLKQDTQETPLTIYLNEPSECNWESTKEINFDSMTNKMECNTDVNDRGLLGWECSTTLTELTNEENNFYIKCRDQPWLMDTENESLRMTNSEDFIYTLIGTRNNLVIDSTSPSGAVEKGIEPATVELEVKTSGGIENGKSVCDFSFVGYDSTIQFKDTFSTTHKQKLELVSGDYNIYIKCKDDAGNEALGNATFLLKLDQGAPIVVRAYNDGELRIITNEDAKCYYDFNKCNFNLENGTLMTTGFSKKHGADWNTGKTYYIRCEDIWGNRNNGCAIKVAASSLI